MFFVADWIVVLIKDTVCTQMLSEVRSLSGTAGMIIVSFTQGYCPTV